MKCANSELSKSSRGLDITYLLQTPTGYWKKQKNAKKRKKRLNRFCVICQQFTIIDRALLKRDPKRAKILAKYQSVNS
jgi:hypothetical protein